jgi:hypothetical protein
MLERPLLTRAGYELSTKNLGKLGTRNSDCGTKGKCRIVLPIITPPAVLPFSFRIPLSAFRISPEIRYPHLRRP